MIEETQEKQAEIKEAEVVSETASGRKIGTRLDLILLLILGILLGIVIKTEAVKKITIGKDDYKLGSLENVYNINQIQKDLAEKQAREQEALQSQTQSQGENIQEGEGSVQN